MPLALGYVVCESRPDSPVPLHEGGDWQAEAHFLLSSPTELHEALLDAELADRPHPPNLSSLISADLLFEDGEITGRTQLSVDELPLLYAHVSADLQVRLRAWEAFALRLEDQGQVTRFIVWFIR